MFVRIGAFDHADYDADADVLYLSIGTPREGYGEETREGHFLRFDEHGEFCGVTLIDAGELASTGQLHCRAELRLSRQEWDVTDAHAREEAARQELGDDYDWYCKQHAAQWWIKKDCNAAALAKYRCPPE